MQDPQVLNNEIPWLALGSFLLHKEHLISEAIFKVNFKFSLKVTSLVWTDIAECPVTPVDFLWTLYYLKSRNPNETQIALSLGTNPQTLRSHVVNTLNCLNDALPEFIFDEDRFYDWPHLNPSSCVDTTSVLIPAPYLSSWEYYSVDKKSHCLKYQVACTLGKPFRILIFSGPFKGSASDVGIARFTVVPLLLPDEVMAADKGYRQDDHFWTPPPGNMKDLTEEQKIERRKVTRTRQINERVIGRLTFWGIFKKKWKYGFGLHALCAKVAAKLTQIELLVYPLT